MQIHSLVVDDFLDDWDSVRKGADSIVFKDETNPVDKVVYPHIFKDIPRPRLREIETKLLLLVSVPITIRTAFVRLSPKGVHVPHQVHTDYSMGDYSVMIYLNRAEHCRGGTSILQHETGMETHPQTDEELKLWQRDHNDEAKWKITHFTPMRPNRLFLFRSDLFHRAEPVGGFGETARNGRMVLTVFFDVAEGEIARL